MNGRTRTLLMVAAILAATSIAYLPALSCGFIWDDDDHVTQNPVLRSAAGLLRIWFEPSSLPQYYPLVHTTFWIEFSIWGLAPFGYHLVNVLLHAANAALVFTILRRLELPGAAFAALVFALHPVHVESVAWITERKNVLSGLFYLSSLLAWMRWRPFDGGPPGARRTYWLAIALFVCALFSKTVACSLPAVILLLVWWKQGRISRDVVFAVIPMFVLGLGFALATAWLELVHVRAEGAAFGLSVLERVLVAGRALWFYAGKLVWPAELTFSYPRWQVDTSAIWQYAFPASAAVAIAGLYLVRGRIGRGPVVASLFFAGTLFPALGFINVFPMRYSFVADHFQYLASLGVLVPVCVMAARVGRWPVVRTVVAVLTLALLAMLTWRQTKIYEGHETLWLDTLRKNPESWMAHTNLAKVRMDSGDYDTAIEHLEQALAIDDSMFETQVNLGAAYAETGRLGSARDRFERAIELKPGHATAYNNLAYVLHMQGDSRGAIENLRKALGIAPRDAASNSSMGGVYADLGRYREALPYLRTAIQLDASNFDAVTTLARCLRELGDLDSAIRLGVSALRTRPGHEGFRAELVAALARKTADSPPEEGVAVAERACSAIESQLAVILEDLSLVHRRDGRPEHAQHAARVAMRRRAESRDTDK